ncbi:6,7-dimethyl-8-ribityllumazine synthase [Pandoraea commovens]|uniref:6,7-dimethyl-8-ribityllumazine synthase n=1 Tax=Pandoraea commovens TaxID=2508289 RepID=A0A5E4WLA6_9BURK|nr:6,7-dimethyl-8-ribityllumazine synthase [Pandoraea commovens]UVA80683.1 6,7-dimethyl-8-ribityllumazine synthase [Pandoraea commovens]VVE24943.1 6,7-dimethyl-8-ribityllumazine synthase [Pandoraea commovens]
MEIGQYQPELDGEGLRVGIVQSRFNDAVCTALRTAAVAELDRLGVDGEDVLLVTVPGALEIPLALQKMAESGQFDALIALGAVIRGETYHFELVSNESGAGITRIGLDFGIPIANAVLTTENDEQAEVRAAEKGRDAARVAVEMANLLEAIDMLSGDDAEDEDEDEEEEDR